MKRARYSHSKADFVIHDEVAKIPELRRAQRLAIEEALRAFGPSHVPLYSGRAGGMSWLAALHGFPVRPHGWVACKVSA